MRYQDKNLKDKENGEREREREREHRLLNHTTRVQSIIKEKSHKFQQRLFIRSCPNFDVVFVFVKLLLHSLVIFFALVHFYE